MFEISIVDAEFPTRDSYLERLTVGKTTIKKVHLSDEK